MSGNKTASKLSGGDEAIPLHHVRHTDESGVGSEAQACRVLQTAAGSHIAGLAVTEEVSQSGPGNNTHNTHLASHTDSEGGSNSEASQV